MRLRQLGMSLIEIMVAVAIGLIGILIITQAYIMSDNFNRATLGEGGAQTNGLLALYSLEKDARIIIPQMTVHRLGCDEESADILEVSRGRFDEADIVRLEDDYRVVT